MIDYYTGQELAALGFASIGDNVRISRSSAIYNRERVYIGSNVRIDNFCTLAISGGAILRIGQHVHLSAYNFLNGLADILLGDFVTSAPFVRFFSSTDDYSGEHLTGGTIDPAFLGTRSGAITVESYSIIGTGSTIMPNVCLRTGTAIGAHSFVTESTAEFGIYAGIPAVLVKPRSRLLVESARKYLSRETDGS